MNECLGSVGFVFNNVKTCIKKDKILKYQNIYCQECIFICGQGSLSPCNSCFNNSQYKICIFKLTKENFVTSSLGISSNREESWDIFKKNIIYQKNGNYVISITKNKKLHSFYANLIKAKVCNCCESVLLYFKYNIISMLSCYDKFLYYRNQNLNNNMSNNNNLENRFIEEENLNDSLYVQVCASLYSNITYKLKSDTYDTVRFYYSQNYTYKPQICF